MASYEYKTMIFKPLPDNIVTDDVGYLFYEVYLKNSLMDEDNPFAESFEDKHMLDKYLDADKLYEQGLLEINYTNKEVFELTTWTVDDLLLFASQELKDKNAYWKWTT